MFDLPVLTQTDKINKPILAIIQPVEPEVKPKESVKYIIQAGDTLEKIAKAHNTTVQRLFNANSDIADPNRIEPAQVVVVPENTDVLQPREMPAKVEIPSLKASGTSITGGSSSSGNLYTPGYCTYYVKNMRPDMPNNLGNADTWYYRYQGAKGSTPRVGAVAVAVGYMHVAIVTGVSGSQVTVSEMNYGGLWVVSSRVAPASEFLYIY